MPFMSRLHNLQTLFAKEKCDAYIVDDPTNLYYLTGCELSSGRLIAHSQGAYLVVDKRYFEFCSKHSPFPVLPLEENDWPELFTRQGLRYITKPGFDSEQTSYAKYSEWQAALKEKIELIPLKNLVKILRTCKNSAEISILREAAELGSQGFDFLCSLIKEGITEIEMANELEIFWKKRGSKTVAFDPIIAFGPNSSMPHYRPGPVKLKKGNSILIDIGVNFKHYHSDMTRVVFFGRPDEKILEIFSVVHEAQKAALFACRPGVLIGELDRIARKIIEQKGYGEFFTHSLGHGIGLEIHEFPVIRNRPPFDTIELQEGMVITIEPGIYLPGIGGVRLEDSVVIVKNGYENLTNRPIEIISL